VFGLTETTITSTLYRTDEGPADRMELPIGRPLGNSRVYLLDGWGEPVPIGVVGDLYIGGQGVGRGYLGQAALTAERFVPDALSGEPGARLYRAGDLARFGADGNLEFLGRRDHQVKVRGFRVELAEVETALQRHPDVGEAVAVAHRDGPAGVRLVAYVQPATGRGEPLSGKELRELLVEALPEYMVPAALEVVAELPRTATGKVDRGALPAPRWGAEDATEYVAPCGAREETLASIWKEVLGLERVGVAENFFELGGDSILSIQVVSRAHRAGLRLTPKQLFQYPTVAALASVAREVEPAEEAEAGPAEGEAPLTPVQRWFFEREPARPGHWNLSVFLIVRQRLEAAPLGRALAALVAHHDALRLRYRRSEAGWVQEHGTAAGGWPLLEVDLSDLPAWQVGPELARAGGQTQASLDLGRGPLARAVLYRLGSGQGDRLLLAAHHLVVDGVSWRILLEDLETTYGQSAAGREFSLPAKTTSFQSWGEGLLAYARSEALRAELPYWTAAQRDAVPAVPLDHPAGSNVEGSAEAVTVALEPGLTRVLLREVPGVYHTEIQDVLLAALARTFEEWTGQPRLLLDLEGHGREEEAVPGADLTRTVGWLATLTPVLLNLSGAAGPGGAIKAVKEQLRAIPKRGIGHGVLRHLDPECSALLRRLPQGEVIFEYMGRLDRALPESTPFALAPESAGPEADPLCLRPHLLSIWGGVVDGELQISWTYSRNLHKRSTVELLAERCIAILRELIAHCLSPGAGGFTPSDFPLADVDTLCLDRLIAQIGSQRVEDIYSLSPMQQGMLFHTLYDPGAGMYVGQWSLELAGMLDEAALERAWQAMSARHAVLRTAFLWEGLDGPPLQVVCRGVTVPVDHQDWRHLTAEEVGVRWRAYLDEDRRRGFRLSEAPLMRLALIRTGEGIHRLLWSYHMLLLDGWSMPLVLGELFRRYEDFCRGIEPEPLRQESSYRDFIAWQRDRDVESCQDFWRSYLAGFTEPTPLGMDQASEVLPEGRASGYAERRLKISSALTLSLQELARNHRFTLNTLTQAVWALQLSRYSGRDEVVFGVIVSGRPPEIAGVESIVGLFINALPARVQVPTQELRTWMSQLQQEQAALRQYEYVPLAQIQAWSEVAAEQDLFESILVFDNYPVEDAGPSPASDLAFRALELEEQNNYAITLSILPHDRLELFAGYDPRRFEAVAIERMLGHFESLLEQISGDLERSPAALSLLREAERHQLAVDWNDTGFGCGSLLCLHEMFAAQAEKCPDRIAIVDGDRRLTYRDLDVRSDRLAHYLVALGIGPEQLVGVAMDRSAEMVMALFGILKAGGAYVPLDPGYPQDRLAYMLADSGAQVLLTQSWLADRFPEHEGLRVLLDPGAFSGAEEGMPEPLAARSRPDNLAYALYTSGSTGRPKGVLIPHQGIVNLVLWMQQTYRLGPSDRMLQKTVFSFDDSVCEFFWPLSVGACLVMAPPGSHQDPGQLARLIQEHEITTLQFVPSMLQILLEEPEIASNCRSVRRVIASGEALPYTLKERFFERLPKSELHNLYGPTEASVDVTFQ
ncbi:MAG TPA: condensation domain-containing protein, partial [Thermoanaerobaculia bacterium]|nr:condensation domain-containing protein [Thermoanaerobaculia bacterium]